MKRMTAMRLEEKSFTIYIIGIEGFSTAYFFIHITCNFKFVFSKHALTLGYCSLLVFLPLI